MTARLGTTGRPSSEGRGQLAAALGLLLAVLAEEEELSFDDDDEAVELEELSFDDDEPLDELLSDEEAALRLSVR